MPQAPEHLRAKFSGDWEAWLRLAPNFTNKAGLLRPRRAGYVPTDADYDAIDYLVMEWDYAYEPTVHSGDAPASAPLAGGSARKPRNPQWLADQHRRQEERRCYVCGGRDDGGCNGIDGERAECPWF